MKQKPKNTNNPFQIEQSQIHSLSQNVPYTVLQLRNVNDTEIAKPMVLYDFYYMRTAPSIEKAVKKAEQEFKNRGFKPAQFTPDYSVGTIQFKEGEAIIKPTPASIKGMNFWVPEGLVSEYFSNNNIETPKIKTERTPTKKLYKQIYKPHEITESDVDLVKLLRDPEKTCKIRLSRVYKGNLELSDAAGGDSPAKSAIMNYGYIWDRHTTIFQDPETDLWYNLLNKNTLSKNGREDYKKLLGKKLPKLHTLYKVESDTFREADKVECNNHYFFDGSMKDVFEILRKSGVKFDLNNKAI